MPPKPKFDPNKPFEAGGSKPKFDPSQPFKSEDGEAIATKKAAEKFENDRPSMAESAGMGIGKGAFMNWADKGYGLVGPEDYETNRLRYLDRERRAEAENPTTFGVGEFGGAVATIPATMNPFRAAAIAGAQGVARTLGREDDWDLDTAKEAGAVGAVDAATAGVATKVLPPIANAVMKPADKIREYLRNKAGTQASKALKPNLKMVEEAGDDLPEIGKLMLDEKVVTPFASQDEMANRTYDLKKRLDRKMDPIYEATHNQSISREDLANAIESKIQDANMKMKDIRRGPPLQSYKDDALSSGQNFFNPQDLRELRGKIGEDVKEFGKAGQSASQKAAQDMYFLTRDQEMGLIDKANPSLRKENEDLFRKASLNYQAMKMADKGSAKSDTHNLFGMNSWNSGQLAATGAGLGAIAQQTGGAIGVLAAGAAGLVGREILRRYGNQWNASVLNNMSKLVASPKYAGIFQSAISRGGPAVAVAHDMLLRKDPEYKAAFEAAIQQSQGGTEQ